MFFKKSSDSLKIKDRKILNENSFLGKYLYLILAFFIPFILMFTVFAIKGVAPFGTNQILVTDLWHQYYPFLVDFQDKLKTGGSLLWTWKSGGGTNYLALISYYLASPLNFLSILVPASFLRQFLYIITCVKIGCAGLFFAIFLKITFKKNDISITFFSIMYALCSFIMGYYWNVIWLDTIALLPLVIAGTFALLKSGKFRLYIITLALSILANYYIGLFTCIFVLLVSICYSIVEYKGIKNLIFNFLKMAGSSVVAIMMTCILTLPAYFALSHAYSASNSFPTNFAINIGNTADLGGVFQALQKVIANSVAFIEPTAKEGLPNIYCGIIPIIFGILYLFCSKIKLRERLCCLLLLVFFVFSFIIRQLDFIWHGFHFPNMLPYRFSFLYSFVLIFMAFRLFMNIESVKLKSVLFSIVGFIIVIACALVYNETFVIIASSFIAFIVIVWLLLYVLKIVPKTALAAAMCIIAVAEGVCSVVIGIKTVTVTTTTSYPLGTTDTYNCNDYAKKLEASTIDLPRTEVTKYHTLNDNALVGFNGISMFNSLTNQAITKYMEKFGICGWDACNRYTYQQSSPFTNLMLNIKYLISPYGTYLDQDHNELIYNSNSVKLLQNNYYIKQGFMVNEDLLNFDVDLAGINPIDNQNNIFNKATGLDGELYEYLDVVSQGHTEAEKLTVTKKNFGEYSFNKKDSSVTPHFKFNYEASKDGVACAYFSCGNAENVTLKVNDKDVVSNYVKRPYIMTFGNVKKGDKLSIYADIKDAESGSATVYCAMFNDELFQEGYDVLNESVLNATEVSDTKIEGKIDVKEDGLFYTSISYINGWRAYVDGKEVEITPVGNAMLAFELDKGEHTIKLSYVPEGFVIGSLISLFAVFVFAVMCIVSWRIKKSKTKNNEESQLLQEEKPAEQEINSFEQTKDSIDPTQSSLQQEENLTDQKENLEKKEEISIQPEESSSDQEE